MRDQGRLARAVGGPYHRRNMRHNPGLTLIVALALLGLAFHAFGQPNQLTEEQAAQGWRLLFNGQNLDGWTPTGNPGVWSVEDGEIVVNPGGGGWLRTVDQFRDFELFLDFKLTDGANSGLALRASSVDDPAFSGMELQIFDNHGEEPTITGCGAVYDAIVPRSQAVKAPGEWNTYRVLLVGDTLNVWLNGEHIHVDEKLDDRGYRHTPDHPAPLKARVKSGYIAMQDHGDEVRFRNIRIRPIDANPLDAIPTAGEPRWTDLFNGHNLDGWFKTGGGTWTVENGVLVGRDGPGHLYTQREFTDFDLRAKVMVNTRGNGGLYFRARPPADNPDSWPQGYEAQVDHNDPKNLTGAIYGRVNVPELVSRENEWFDYNVRAVGDRITVAINGKTLIETTLDDFDSGHVALQTHHPGNEIRWRDIQIRDLSATPDAGPIGQGKVDDGVVDVFYCTHSAGFEHPAISETHRVMQQLDSENGWLRVLIAEDVSAMTPEMIAGSDVIMFYTTGDLPMSDEQKEAFRVFCELGGGFVGVHCATDTFPNWPWYVEHVGASFNGHPWNADANVAVRVVDRDHPATAHLSSEPWTMTEEIYLFKNEADDRRILLELDPEGSPDLSDGEFPAVAWTRRTGRGRVFYTSLGHNEAVWNDERFQKHLLGGIRWAAGFEERE